MVAATARIIVRCVRRSWTKTLCGVVVQHRARTRKGPGQLWGRTSLFRVSFKRLGLDSLIPKQKCHDYDFSFNFKVRCYVHYTL
jgi:hypothetical protein